LGAQQILDRFSYDFGFTGFINRFIYRVESLREFKALFLKKKEMLPQSYI